MLYPSVAVCVYVWGGGGKASDFPIYNYNFIVFTIFIVALASYRTHSDTDLDSDSATVGVWKAGQWQGEGAEDRRQDRTQSTHSLVNAGQRQKLLLMCSNVYVPPYECISVWERGGQGARGEGGMACFFSACLCMCLWSISVWVNAKKNKMAIRVISNKKLCLSVANCNCQRVSACLRPMREWPKVAPVEGGAHTSVQIKLFQ